LVSSGESVEILLFNQSIQRVVIKLVAGVVFGGELAQTPERVIVITDFTTKTVGALGWPPFFVQLVIGVLTGWVGVAGCPCGLY